VEKADVKIPTSTKKVARLYRWHNLGITSLNQAALIFALCLFFCILVIMFALHFVPITSNYVIPFIDAGLLLILIITLYWLVYRPTWDRQVQYAAEVSHLSRKLMNLVEEERKRISTDLHDHFGQSLSILQLKLERLRKQLSKDDNSQLNLAGNIIQDVSLLSDDLRNIIYELRPVILEDCGLLSSIKSLVEEFSREHPGIKITEDLSISEDFDVNRYGNLSITIFRITQELLNNISKHAKAKKVSVTLQQSDQKLVLKVEDDGKGFVVRRIHGGKRKGYLGIGLLGINERMKELNGSFTLQTEPGKGTLAIVELPMLDTGVGQ